MRRKSDKYIKVILNILKSPIIFMLLLVYLKLNILDYILIGLFIVYLTNKDSDFNLGWHSQYERSIVF